MSTSGTYIMLRLVDGRRKRGDGGRRNLDLVQLYLIQAMKESKAGSIII